MIVSCDEFREDLSSFLDGELEEHRQTALSEHLSLCGGCQSNHDSFKGVGSLLRHITARVQEEAPDIWNAVSIKLPGVCECIQDDLSAYLDGELIATAKEGVSSHLEQCGICHEKFQSLSKVNSLLSTGLVLSDSVEVDIWAGVKARLNEDCALIQSELSPFIDREVATLRHRTITSHLTECGECTEDFNELSQTGDILRSYYQPQIAEDFDLWPSIQSKMNVIPIEAHKEKRHAPLAVRRLYAVAAAVVAGVAVSAGIMWYSHMNSPQVAPVTAEAYLIDQSMGDPADVAEAVVYDRTP